MGVLFKDMSLDDCHLRLSGSWVVLVHADGVTPGMVRELGGSYVTGGFMADRVWLSGMDDGIEVDDILYNCPPLGYVQLAAGAAYLQRVPERQTRTGMPNHSTTAQLHPGAGSTRMDGLRVSLCKEIAQAAYLGGYVQPHRAFTTQGRHAVSGALCVDNITGSAGKLYASGFLEAGEFTFSGDAVQVSTPHPLMVQALIRGMYDLE